jgi:hypothetical protein
VFFTSKILVKIYRVSRKISYNRNPVNNSLITGKLLNKGAVQFFQGDKLFGRDI